MLTTKSTMIISLSTESLIKVSFYRQELLSLFELDFSDPLPSKAHSKYDTPL